MGWTGCRKEEFADIKDFVNEYISQYVNKPEHKLKKSVKRRTEFFYLINSSGEDWILKIITQTKDGYYWRKEIQMNPHESGVPISLLKKFVPKDEKNEKWLKEEMELAIKQKREKEHKKVEVGDVVECKAASNICFCSGEKIQKDETFYLLVEGKPCSKREKKFFRVVNKQEKEDGTYFFVKTNKIVTREIYNASESNNLGKKSVNQ